MAASLLVALLGAPLTLEAQPTGKVARIGYLVLSAGPTPYTQSFLEGLRDLGYVEGQHFVMEYRRAAGKTERLPELATDLVRAKVDLIVTGGTAATVAAKRATQTIPIVFGSAGDPVEKGIVASLGRPGGNVTGLAIHLGPAKHIQLLTEAVPKVSRLAYLYDPGVFSPDDYRKTLLASLEADARALNVKLKAVPMRERGEAERVFSEIMSRSGPNGLLLENAPHILAARERLCALALQQRLSTMGRSREFVDAGCLMSYGESLVEMYRRAAYFVDRILKGAKPADLPIEQPTKFELVINMKTAKALGLTIPPSVLVRADEVIQ